MEIVGRAGEASVAGTGSNATAEADRASCSTPRPLAPTGPLVVTPYYNRPSQEGLYRHFAALAEACDLADPALQRSRAARAWDMANGDGGASSADSRPSSGIKDATGDLTRESLMRRQCPEGFALISGDDGSALGYIAQGGHGVFSVTSNVAPGPDGEDDPRRPGEGRISPTALALNDSLALLHKALFLDASPAPTKFALDRLGFCSDELRLPLATVRGGP